ncbi:DUF1499 domain-containing protein [Elusimicrobiota bacterium]
MKRPLLTIAAVIAFAGCSGTRPAHIGPANADLAPCPSSPNCVSTRATGDQHRIEPMSYDGDKAAARDRLLAALRGMKRSKIVVAEEDYIHVEFASGLWRFVDDAEFRFDGPGKIINFRSEARRGYYDFGMNRKRLEALRKRLQP